MTVHYNIEESPPSLSSLTFSSSLPLSLLKQYFILVIQYCYKKQTKFHSQSADAPLDLDVVDSTLCCGKTFCLGVAFIG